MWNKRAASVLLIIFEILAVVVVGGAMIRAASGLASSDATERALLSQDLSMMVDVLVATPGDLRVVYPGDVSAYTFFLRDDGVYVVGADGETSSFYSLPQGWQVSGIVEASSQLCLAKEGRRIFLLDSC